LAVGKVLTEDFDISMTLEPLGELIGRVKMPHASVEVSIEDR
jgi:hypothetical protein